MACGIIPGIPGTDKHAATAWRTAIGGIALTALTLRLLHLAQLHGTAFFQVLVVDSQQYDAWAQQIAAGNGAGTGVFYQTPLYPYLLACLYKVAGHHVLLVRVVQSVLGALACVLLAIAGRRFFGPRVGIIAGLLLAVYPEAIFWDGLLQKSSLDLLLMTLLLAVLGVYIARPGSRWLLVAGLIAGALMLNRENARVLLPCVGAWLVAYPANVTLRARLTRALWFVVGIAAVLLPVGARNYAVGGEFLVSTSQLGPNFYIGNRAGASGTYEPLVANHGNPLDERDDAVRLAEQSGGHALSPGAVSNFWLQRAFEDIRQQPAAWLRLMSRKLLLTIQAGEIVDTESMQEYAQFSSLLRGLRWLNLGIVLPLAALGVWVTRREWRSLSVLYAIGGGLILSVTLFYVVSRYRFPMVPVMLLFAAAALSDVPRLRSVWRSWIPGLAVAAGLAVLSHGLVAPVSNYTFGNVGAQLVRLGRPGEAVSLLEQAITIAPNDARAHYDLAVALEHLGERNRALAEFGTAVRLQPDFGEAHDALGSALRARGRRTEALAEFAEATRSRPDSAPFQLNYGVALWEAGDRDAAVARYREAVRLKPDNSAAHNNLAAALHQTGHAADAIPHYLEALRLNPDYPEAHSNLALALEETGRVDEAVDHFRAALRLRPDSYGTHANYGDLLSRRGRVSEAIVEYEASVRLMPSDPATAISLLRRLADEYARANQRPQAVDALKRAVVIAHSAGRDDLAAELARVPLGWKR